MKSEKSLHLQDKSDSELPFEIKAISALGISVTADALDYVGAPIFAMPIIGDVADLIISGLLYRITRSKVSVAINALEFIPFIGDFVPTYTISTLLWILNESRRRHGHKGIESKTKAEKMNLEKVSLKTRIMRANAVQRSKTYCKNANM